MAAFIIFLTIGFLVLLIVVSVLINNQIIKKKNMVLQSFGSIEIYLKKRFDLLPNLVSTLNKYIAHEADIMLKVTELRSRVNKSESQNEKIEASNDLTNLVSGLNINVENYPDIKADKQFLNLQLELSDLEDQISASRRAYNASVTSYNNQIEMFPSSIIARFRKDVQESLLEIPKVEQVEVNLEQLLNK